MHPLDALGSPLRREILRHLQEKPQAVGDLAARFPVSRPAISRQLRTLEEAGLVSSRTEGTSNIYSVRPEGFGAVQEFLDQFWDEALANLARLAAEAQ